MTNQLATEYKTYLTQLDDFVSKHLNQYVLIKGSQVINFYETYKEALKDGYSKFGNEPFFVKIVAREEEVHIFH